MSENIIVDRERLYDEVIAPEALKLAMLCKLHGMKMICTIQYAEGTIDSFGTATTQVIDRDVPLRMWLIYLATYCKNNIDSMFINLIRYCNEHNIDLSQSMFLAPYSKHKQ